LKILIISQYFWPENFRVNELVEELLKYGHNITILTGYPNYPEGEIYSEFKKNRSKFEQFNGAEIIRVPILPRKKSKINLSLNYLSFFINSIFFGYFKLRNKDFDLIFTFQLSPITVGITSAFFAKIKKSINVIWVLDLWPDTLVALNILKRKWEIKLFKILVNWIYSKCDLILAQSKNMLDEINLYSGVRNNTVYFPSWGDSDLFKEATEPAPEIKVKNLFTIIFAGNIGEAQDFPNLIKAVQKLNSENIKNFRIILIGDGSKKDWLLKEIKILRLEKFFEFYKNYPLKRMSSFFIHADALYVSLLNKKVFNMTIPGKIQFYLSAGLPIIGMICGEGAEVIRNSKAGFVCDSGDYVKLCQIIKEIIKLDKNDLNIMGRNGRLYSEREFSKSKLIRKLNKIFLNQIRIKDSENLL